MSEIRMWSWSDGHVDRELSSGGLAYERSHRESENPESRGLVNFDIVNAEIAMSEIPIRSGPLDQVLIRGLLFFLTH
jgi:hypothetical protein